MRFRTGQLRPECKLLLPDGPGRAYVRDLYYSVAQRLSNHLDIEEFGIGQP